MSLSVGMKLADHDAQCGFLAAVASSHPDWGVLFLSGVDGRLSHSTADDDDFGALGASGIGRAQAHMHLRVL